MPMRSWVCGHPLECGQPTKCQILKENGLYLQDLSTANSSSSRGETSCPPPYLTLGFGLVTSWVLWKQSLRGRLRYAYLLGFRSFVAEREEISFGERKGLEQDSVPSKSQPYARALWKVFGLSQKWLMFIPNGQVFQFLPLSTIDVVPPGKGRACP